jgi:hypothetical protein
MSDLEDAMNALGNPSERLQEALDLVHGVDTSCRKVIIWHDTGMAAYCILDKKHSGNHFDGMTWFDNDGYAQAGPD